MPARTSIAAVLLGAAILSACQASGRLEGPALDRYLCTAEDLPFDVIEQARGDFTAADLGGLSRDPEVRKAEYRAAGMEGGRFGFWKQALPRPPFESPLNVVCQVIAFDSSAAAASWVANLEADPVRIRDSGMLWAPLGEARAEELPAERGRLFRLEGTEGEARVTLFAHHVARGHLVLSVFVGDRDGRTEAVMALAIAASRDARLGEPATSGSR